jgi:hypothetical protein
MKVGFLFLLVAVVVAVAVALVLLAALAVASDVMVEMLEELYQAFQDFLKE